MDADEYVIVLDQAGGLVPNKEFQSGVNLVGVPYQALFTNGIEFNVDDVPRGAVENSTYMNEMSMIAANTQIHEIGHSFAVGEADDRSTLEDPVLKF